MKISVKRKSITAATSTEDMLDAFQERLAELSVGGSTEVTAATDEKAVEIKDSDYDNRYEDVEGGFGEAGAVYSLGEIKEYWNKSHDGDPVLAEYDSYEDWWKDTRDNFLKETD